MMNRRLIYKEGVRSQLLARVTSFSLLAGQDCILWAPIFFQLVMKRLQADAKYLSSSRLVVTRRLQSFQDEQFFCLAHRRPHAQVNGIGIVRYRPNTLAKA